MHVGLPIILLINTTIFYIFLFLHLGNGRLAIGINQQTDGNQTQVEPGTQFMGDLTRFNIWSVVLGSIQLRSVMECTYDGYGEFLAWPDLRYWRHGDLRLQYDQNQTCNDQLDLHNGKLKRYPVVQ